LANLVAQRLEVAGLNSWIDVNETVDPTDPWPMLSDGIRGAEAIVWVSSLRTRISRWIVLELSEAARLGMPVFCVVEHGEPIEEQLRFVLDRLPT
jgi:hypothetical protein